MYCALFLIFWIEIYQNEAVAFEDFVLEKQINYASESAVDEMLAAGNLNQDYAEGDFLTLEPSVALRDFGVTLCYDFDIVPTEDSLKSVIDKNIRTLAVCVYDGVYLYYRQQTETHTVEMKQSPKIPYFYTDKNTGVQYCLTLNPDKGYWDSGNSADYSMHFYDKYEVKPSEDLQATAINDRVADLVNWGLYETYESEYDSDTSVSIPATGETVRGEQPVRSPTVIGVVDGNVKSYGTVVTAECIGGAQLEETDQIIGFRLVNCPLPTYTDSVSGITYGGDEALAKGASLSNSQNAVLNGKFYARSSWWKRHSYFKDYLPASDADHPDLDRKYFDDEYEAAKNGYNDISICE